MEFKLGDKVFVKGAINDFATIKFYGLTDFASGYWVGLELDSKIGKNNGSVHGVQYFDMIDRGDSLNHGLFTRAEQIRPVTETENQLLLKLNRVNDQLNVLNNQNGKVKESYESQIEDLVSTIDNLSLHETDLLSKMNELKNKIDELERENVDLKAELLSWETLDDNTDDSAEDLNKIDMKKVFTQNKQFQRIIENLKVSSNEVIKQYEKSLDDNTSLVKRNIELNDKISELNLENKQNTTLITELRERLESIDESDTVIQYLTETNNNLTVEINKLKDELIERDKIIEELNSAHLDQDKIQCEMKTINDELNTTINLLESEYEKTILLTNELNNSKNELMSTRNQNTVLKMEFEKMRIYRKIGEFILNKSDETSLDLFSIQFQIFQILFRNKSINGNESLNFQMDLYLQMISSMTIYFKNNNDSKFSLLLETDTSDVLKKLVNLFKGWNDSLLNDNKKTIELNDLHIAIVFDTIIKYFSLMDSNENNMRNKYELIILIISDIFKNVISKVVMSINKDRTHDEISDIIGTLKKITMKIDKRSNNYFNVIDLNQFKDIIEEIFKTSTNCIIDNNKEFIDLVIHKFNNYIIEIQTSIDTEGNTPKNESSITNKELTNLEAINNDCFSIETWDATKEENMKKQKQREQLIDELQLKINVLTVKANEAKIRDKINIELKDEVDNLTKKLYQENEKVKNYNDKMNRMEKDLKELKFDNLQLIKDKNLVSTYLTVDEIEKKDLMTEIHYLKNDILNKWQNKNSNRMLMNHSPLEWLKRDKLLYEKRQRQLKISHSLNTDKLDTNMDRLLQNLSKLINEIIVHDLPIDQNSNNTKTVDRIQRYDNIVKNSIKEF